LSSDPEPVMDKIRLANSGSCDKFSTVGEGFTMPLESADMMHLCRRCPRQFHSVSAHAIESVPNFKQYCGRLLTHAHIRLSFLAEGYTIDFPQ
jgi:hypothetical protein